MTRSRRSAMQSNHQWFRTFGLVVLVMILFTGLYLVGTALGWIGQAADVTTNEFGPAAALAKYQWFIDQANKIKKADADIKLNEKRRTDVETQFTTTYGTDKSKWAPSTSLQYNMATQTARDDLIAVVSNRNRLVEEYNAQSEKFNWAPFMSRTDLPPQIISTYTVQ